jgi:hypothetical protein
MTLRPWLPLAGLLVPVATALAPGPPTAAREVPDLARLNRDLQALSDRVKPSVVQVLTTGYESADGRLMKQRASGCRGT